MEDLKNIKEAAVRMALHCGKIQMESFRTQNIGIDTKSNVYDVVPPTPSWVKRQVSICMLTATGHGWWTKDNSAALRLRN